MPAVAAAAPLIPKATAIAGKALPYLTKLLTSAKVMGPAALQFGVDTATSGDIVGAGRRAVLDLGLSALTLGGGRLARAKKLLPKAIGSGKGFQRLETGLSLGMSGLGVPFIDNTIFGGNPQQTVNTINPADLTTTSVPQASQSYANLVPGGLNPYANTLQGMQVNSMMESLLADAVSGGGSKASMYAQSMMPSVSDYLMPQSAFNMPQF
jgi:hypothetical protein